MTSWAANWLTRTFQCLFDDSNRGSRVRGLRFAPPCLEALESRKLPSNASGVWSFVSEPRLHPMRVNVLTLQPGASLNPIFVAPRQIIQPECIGWRNRPADHGRVRESYLVSPSFQRKQGASDRLPSSDLVRQAGVNLVAGNDRGDCTEQLGRWHAAAGGPLRHLQPTLSERSCRSEHRTDSRWTSTSS